MGFFDRVKKKVKKIFKRVKKSTVYKAATGKRSTSSKVTSAATGRKYTPNKSSNSSSNNKQTTRDNPTKVVVNKSGGNNNKQTTRDNPTKVVVNRDEKTRAGKILDVAGEVLTSEIKQQISSTAETTPIRDGKFDPKAAGKLGVKVAGGAAGGVLAGIFAGAAGGTLFAEASTGIAGLSGWAAAKWGFRGAVTAGTTVVGVDMMKVWFVADNMVTSSIMAYNKYSDDIPWNDAITHDDITGRYNDTRANLETQIATIEASVHMNPALIFAGQTFLDGVNLQLANLDQRYADDLGRIILRDQKALEKEDIMGDANALQYRKENEGQTSRDFWREYQEEKRALSEEERAYWDAKEAELSEQDFIALWNSGKSSLKFGVLGGGSGGENPNANLDATRERINSTP